MSYSPHLTRVETELSYAWAKENPALFVEAMQSFFLEYPARLWKHRIDGTRPGFVTLIAVRSQT